MPSLARTFLLASPLVLLPALTLTAPGCGSENDESADGGVNGEGGAGGEGSQGGEGGSLIDQFVDSPFGRCQVGSTQCTNCIDDDKDGLVDWLDPECSGPLDNDESSFGTGIPGDNVDPCKQDCFFDGNSGSGNDGCEWEVGCLRPNPDPARCPDMSTDDQRCKKQQPQKCLDYCRPLTPNGCDCMGCCQVPRPAGGFAYVRLESTCSTQTLDDPAKCHTCTQLPPGPDSCINTCDTCELCIGKTSLPPECTTNTTPDSGNPTGQTCSDGRQVCNATTACAIGYYCVTGCCVPKVN